MNNKRNEVNPKRLLFISVAILLIVALMTLILFLFPTNQFEQEINDTVSKVTGKSSDLNLILVTDIHYDPTKDEPIVVSPTMECASKVMTEIENKGKEINALWNLGDFINGHNTDKAGAIEQIQTVVRAEAKITRNYHNIVGNHDNNIQATRGESGLPESEILSVIELNDILANNSTTQTEVHNPARLTDYYVDFDEQEIRVVCISADEVTFLPETVKWLSEIALDTDKEVLLLSHIPTRPEWGFKNDIQNGDLVESAIKSFISKGGTVICFIHGHDHGDMISEVKDEEGKKLFSEVAIGCARFQYPQSNGTEGMTFWQRNVKDETMLLFDVVSIDKVNKVVYFTRFGAGEDRMISYESITGQEN